jgi:hypothetical protein
MRFSKSFLEESLVLQQRIAYTGANPEYLGYADPGVADNEEGWLIVKWTYDVNTYAETKKFADGSKAFNKAWSERANYDYS